MSTQKQSKRKHSKVSKKGLGTKNFLDEEELKHLEKVVLGTGPEAFQESDSEDDSDKETINKRRKEVELKKPAWVDEDDSITFSEAVQIQQRRCEPGISGSKKYQDVMEQKYQKVMGIPKWSRQKKDDHPSDSLLKTCGNFIKKSKFLDKGKLDIKKLKDLNYETHTEGPVINVVKFHTKSTVAMVAGLSGVVSLFQVDGKQNSKLLSLQFQRYPIHCGSFLRNGEEFLIGSKFYKYFYCHNLITGQSIKINTGKMVDNSHTQNFCVSPNDKVIAVCGDFGKIYLFAASTKEYIDCFQMNCEVTALDFNDSGSLLYSHGEEGEVYVWDMNSRMCINKFYDEGCIKGTAISLSPNNQLLACGADSGVVNVYNTENIKYGEPTSPLKAIYNLVTPITGVKFNSSCEILASVSNYKKNAVKLIHCPSMTTFSNFPAFHSKMNKPTSLDFSPNSGYFAVGDNKGTVHLYRLKYYGNY